MTETETTAESLSLPQQRDIEVIAELKRAHGQARMTDVAESLGVRLPSASEAVKRLVANGLALRPARSEVALTQEGQRIARELDLRHQALKRFMVNVMAMDPEHADTLACRVEHCVDSDFAKRLVDVEGFMEREHPDTIAAIADYVRKRQD
jgi:DtxR family Mn-dependent transcriptional regulator